VGVPFEQALLLEGSTFPLLGVVRAVARFEASFLSTGLGGAAAGFKASI